MCAAALAFGLAFLRPLPAATELPPPVDRPVDFVRDVQPILTSRCVVCHGASKMGGLRLDSGQDALRGGAHGPAIVAGDSASSRLIRYVAGVDEKVVMPPAGERLSAEQVGILRTWIDSGAKWADERETAGAGKSSHWAFQPIRKPAPPRVKDAAWPRNEIDGFVLRRLEEKQIAPSPKADRRTLARRLSFDLTGLPPSPEQLGGFLADQRDGAYERYVDSLLDSPHFAEHWARYWLDLARYADSDGYRGDRFRPHAWRWRQWVIEAINRDMPFDEFTIEQIAGDLLPNATVEQRVATGFHRNTLTNREGGIDPEQFRVEQVYDRISTIGVVWLGLTVQCAQCHDHKFDPIPQRDFYRLFALFNSADETEIDAPMPGEREPYERTHAEYLAKRNELLERYDVATHLADWEKNVLEAAAHPGERPDWDITFDDLRTYLDRGEKILRTPLLERTWKQQKSFTDYFLANYERVMSKEAYAKLGYKDLLKKLRELDETYPQISQAPVIEELPRHRPSFIHIRGQYKDKGERVTPGVLSALHPLKVESPTRLDLARWLMADDNPLTARVMVNRYWQQLFGKGIVSTPENFGLQGAKPTHPELLDWLATEFRENGWSRKKLIKTIVMSSTYRQSSNARPELDEIDPGNDLLARQSRTRLSAEEIRDAALAVSGLLDHRVGGKSVRPPQPAGAARLGGEEWEASEGADRYRRGLYVVQMRMSPYPLMTNFDMPSAYGPSCQRDRSNTPLQALNLLNDPVFLEAAQALAKRALDSKPAAKFDERLDELFELALARPPDKVERDEMKSTFEKQRTLLSSHSKAAEELAPFEIAGVARTDAAAWVGVSTVLLNLNEFITRE